MKLCTPNDGARATRWLLACAVWVRTAAARWHSDARAARTTTHGIPAHLAHRAAASKQKWLATAANKTTKQSGFHVANPWTLFTPSNPTRRDRTNSFSFAKQPKQLVKVNVNNEWNDRHAPSVTWYIYRILIGLSWEDAFLPRDASAERGYEIAFVRPSVCPSVTIRYRDQIGWNSSKIILRPNSLKSMCSMTPNIGDLVHRATGTPPKLGLNRGGVRST